MKRPQIVSEFALGRSLFKAGPLLYRKITMHNNMCILYSDFSANLDRLSEILCKLFYIKYKEFNQKRLGSFRGKVTTIRNLTHSHQTTVQQFVMYEFSSSFMSLLAFTILLSIAQSPNTSATLFRLCYVIINYKKGLLLCNIFKWGWFFRLISNRECGGRNGFSNF